MKTPAIDVWNAASEEAVATEWARADIGPFLEMIDEKLNECMKDYSIADLKIHLSMIETCAAVAIKTLDGTLEV